MDPFIILVLTHFVSDWFFQPTKWALTKIQNRKSRLFHSIQYIMIFLPVLWILNIGLYWLIYLFATHYIIDSYAPVKIWNKIRDFGSKKQSQMGLMTVQDQIIHILLLIPLV